MSVEECDDDEPETPEYISPVNALEKCEETLIPEPLTSVYSQRGRTTKRTTWDEIAQRSKLQTLWGVKVFRGRSLPHLPKLRKYENVSTI